MKTYMPLNGLRWSRNSGSANCDMPQSAVFGRPGGGAALSFFESVVPIYMVGYVSCLYDYLFGYLNERCLCINCFQ